MDAEAAAANDAAKGKPAEEPAVDGAIVAGMSQAADVVAADSTLAENDVRKYADGKKKSIKGEAAKLSEPDQQKQLISATDQACDGVVTEHSGRESERRAKMSAAKAKLAGVAKLRGKAAFDELQKIQQEISAAAATVEQTKNIAVAQIDTGLQRSIAA
jgi:hypothetical protein